MWVLQAQDTPLPNSSGITGVVYVHNVYRNESELELEASRERMERQQVHLQHAREIVMANAKRAKKLVEGVDEWRVFQVNYTSLLYT